MFPVSTIGKNYVTIKYTSNYIKINQFQVPLIERALSDYIGENVSSGLNTIYFILKKVTVVNICKSNMTMVNVGNLFLIAHF